MHRVTTEGRAQGERFSGPFHFGSMGNEMIKTRTLPCRRAMWSCLASDLDDLMADDEGRCGIGRGKWRGLSLWYRQG